MAFILFVIYYLFIYSFITCCTKVRQYSEIEARPRPDDDDDDDDDDNDDDDNR